MDTNISAYGKVQVTVAFRGCGVEGTARLDAILEKRWPKQVGSADGRDSLHVIKATSKPG